MASRVYRETEIGPTHPGKSALKLLIHDFVDRNAISKKLADVIQTPFDPNFQPSQAKSLVKLAQYRVIRMTSNVALTLQKSNLESGTCLAIFF
jgi:hypothetical protein